MEQEWLKRRNKIHTVNNIISKQISFYDICKDVQETNRMLNHPTPYFNKNNLTRYFNIRDHASSAGLIGYDEHGVITWRLNSEVDCSIEALDLAVIRAQNLRSTSGFRLETEDGEPVPYADINPQSYMLIEASTGLFKLFLPTHEDQSVEIHIAPDHTLTMSNAYEDTVRMRPNRKIRKEKREEIAQLVAESQMLDLISLPEPLNAYESFPWDYIHKKHKRDALVLDYIKSHVNGKRWLQYAMMSEDEFQRRNQGKKLVKTFQSNPHNFAIFRGAVRSYQNYREPEEVDFLRVVDL